jgi:hypothetical protein
VQRKEEAAATIKSFLCAHHDYEKFYSVAVAGQSNEVAAAEGGGGGAIQGGHELDISTLQFCPV